MARTRSLKRSAPSSAPYARGQPPLVSGREGLRAVELAYQVLGASRRSFARSG